jgi:hypothetical protein
VHCHTNHASVGLLVNACGNVVQCFCECAMFFVYNTDTVQEHRTLLHKAGTSISHNIAPYTGEPPLKCLTKMPVYDDYGLTATLSLAIYPTQNPLDT